MAQESIFLLDLVLRANLLSSKCLSPTFKSEGMTPTSHVQGRG